MDSHPPNHTSLLLFLHSLGLPFSWVFVEGGESAWRLQGCEGKGWLCSLPSSCPQLMPFAHNGRFTVLALAVHWPLHLYFCWITLSQSIISTKSIWSMWEFPCVQCWLSYLIRPLWLLANKIHINHGKLGCPPVRSGQGQTGSGKNEDKFH